MPNKKGRHSRPPTEVFDAEVAPEQTQEAPVEQRVVPADVVSLSEEEYEALKNELEDTQAKSAEYFEGWQRERADFNNYKRRIERDQSQMQANLLAGLVKNYLVILDDLERALNSRPSGGDGAGWAAGIELICRKLQGILEAEGVKRIPAEGEMFDPTRHEAIVQEDNPEFESGQIIEVLQQGYQIGERIIRPAQVKVAR